MPSSANLAAFIGTIAAVLLHAQTVSAQGTNATCLSQYSWMDNSRQQSPCLMAAYLNSACLADPTDAYVYSLPDDFHYRPPTVEFATPCQCSTVFYSMIGACATCQDRSNLPWSAWQTNCSTDYASVWPASIPSGTSIPAWAYLDVVTADAFNVSAAQANAAQDPPESTAIPAATSSASQSVGFSSSLATGTETAVGAGGTGTVVASSSKKSSNTGAIVGGVVGGVGGAAIIAGIITFLVIRYRRKNGSAPSAEYTSAAGVTGSGPAYTDYPHNGLGTPYAEKPAFDPAAYPHTLGQTPAMPLYNPNDPSTFPPTSTSPSVNDTTVYNASLNQGYAGSNAGGYVPTTMGPSPAPGNVQQPFSHQPGGYSGVAEV